MLILALDTTSEWGGAGLFRDGECLAAAPHQGAANYSVSLFEDVGRLAEQARIRLREVDLFAAANGPGSFTGIRVGLAAVQGWAHGFEKPVRGVSVLEALAEAARAQTRHLIPVLDGRRGEFYTGAFHRQPSNPAARAALPNPQAARFVSSSDAVVLKPDGLSRYVESQVPDGEGASIVVREEDAAAHALRRTFPARFEWKTAGSFVVPSIARLALIAEREGVAAAPRALSAFYVRRPDAELTWRD